MFSFDYILIAMLVLFLATSFIVAPVYAEKHELPEFDEDNLFPDLDKIELTERQDIIQKVEASRPKLGGEIPEDINHRVGATHVGGLYHLTDKPFLIEGAEKLYDKFNSRIIKLWFEPHNYRNKYNYNSDWPLRLNNQPVDTFVELAHLDYYQQVFDMDFSTFFLMAQTERSYTWRKGIDNEEYFQQVEEDMYQIAKYLLENYADREVTFVLQNWEADWLLRGSGEQWESGHWNENVERKTLGMIKWFQARQKGVERARSEIEDSKATVAHAVEVNRVYDILDGIPTVTSHVLPYVNPDLVSYSSYDSSLVDVEKFWHSIELIKHFVEPSKLYGDNNVYIGEIGNPERDKEKNDIVTWLDKSFGVMLAQDIPYILYWELYCNEEVGVDHVFPGETLDEENLRGFWMLRPDGSLGYAGEYLYNILNDKLDQ